MGFRPLEIEGRFAAAPELDVELDGKRLSARRGEPLAVTLLAHGIHVLGRSPKYHRPRGLLCGRGTCGACLARVDGVPSERLCLCRAGEHHAIESQNALGGARHDLLRTVDWVFPGGLDHHHLMTHSTLLNRLAIGFAHRMAGLGTVPDPALTGTPASFVAEQTDVAVVGAGAAGRAAAAAARERGLSVLLLDALAPPSDGVRGETFVVGQYDERELVAFHDDTALRITAGAVIIATGGHEQAPACPGNDLPGLFLRRAAELALDWGVLPGRRVVVAVSERSDASTRQAAVRLCARLTEAGVDLRAVVGPLEVELPPERRRSRGALAALEGGHAVRAVRLAPDDEVIECDAVVWCGRPAPAYELAQQMGIESRWDAAVGGFVPVTDGAGRTSRPDVLVAGEAAGLEAARAAAHGREVGLAAAEYLARAGQREEVL